MTRTKVIPIAVLLLLVLIVAPSFTLAQQNILPGQIVPKECDAKGGCQSICSLATLAQNVLNTGIYIAVFLSAFLFAWAGWLYLTSVAGSEVAKAKATFFNVVVGLVIILAAWLVVDVFIRTLVGASVLPWNKIC